MQVLYCSLQRIGGGCTDHKRRWTLTSTLEIIDTDETLEKGRPKHKLQQRLARGISGDQIECHVLKALTAGIEINREFEVDEAVCIRDLGSLVKFSRHLIPLRRRPLREPDVVAMGKPSASAVRHASYLFCQ